MRMPNVADCCDLSFRHHGMVRTGVRDEFVARGIDLQRIDAFPHHLAGGFAELFGALPVTGYVAQLTLYPVTVGNKTVGIWTAEFEVTNDDEAGVVDAVANVTFGKAFEVLDELFASNR